MMTDVSALQGSSVRDSSGTRGEILTLNDSHLIVGWWNEGAPGVREEEISPDDYRNAQIEVLTLSTGWVPMGHFVEVAEDEDGPRGPSLAEDLETLLTEKPRSPYKTASKTGPALVGKIKHKRDYWDCSKGQHDGYKQRKGGDKYFYKCTGKEGEKKTISRDKGEKAAYQADYKMWWRDRQRMTAPHTRGKKTYSARAKHKAAKRKAAKKKKG
jgi:hypothetical protein